MNKNFPVKEIAKVAVICLLSSTPLIGTFLVPLKLNVFFREETRDVWSKLTLRGAGILCSIIALDNVLWKRNFSSAQPKIEEIDQLYQWFLCVCSILVVLAHVLLSNQSGPNFHNVRNVENLLSIYNSASCSWADCYIFYLFERCFIQQIRSSIVLKSRVSNFALSFPRVYGPIEVILCKIFGRKFFDSWLSPIDFCIHAYFFVYCLHNFCISLATRELIDILISQEDDLVTLIIFTSLLFLWSTSFSFFLK